MKIREFKLSDTKDTAMLISRTFAEFNKNSGTKEAIQRYVDD